VELLEQVQAALADEAAYTTPQLDKLNQQCGRDHCNRRNRILYQLGLYASANSLTMSATSTTHQFKKDFSDAKKWQANIEVNGQTKAVTAANLTDEDVPLLKQYGYGHFLQEKPKPEPVADLHKLSKADLQAKHQEVLGVEADDKLTKEELIKAIEAKKA
jgi:seryl-tRNA synthetase